MLSLQTSHHLVAIYVYIYICVCVCFVHQTFRLMTCRPVVDFIFSEQGYSRLLEHNFNRKIDVSDSLVLWRKNQLLSQEMNPRPLN